ncbi:unnamed protein product [Gemmata massiliana]|uniref:Uncharacterized protein n=1 Tax=Gemmata massiliana TaxID=1210884 RepID=A0A6P2D1S4_9BACT|nr:hypothetical protein [Gemmata massiliana]VTR93340.1 unnamed protein product [Gemmata massiliana]
MSEAAAFINKIHEDKAEPTHWLVFADWFAERSDSLAERYCRRRADFLTHAASKPNRQLSTWGTRKAYRDAVKAWRQDANALNAKHGALLPLAECSMSLLWLRWEDGGHDERIELFTHNCFQNGDAQLLRSWIEGFHENEDYENDEQEEYWLMFRDVAFESLSNKNGGYDLSSFVGPGNLKQAYDHSLFPKANPFPEPF